jgi:hypothetical protein
MLVGTPLQKRMYCVMGYDDPHDPYLFAGWENDLHKSLTYVAAYGGHAYKFIGDPCDDWSEHYD